MNLVLESIYSDYSPDEKALLPWLNRCITHLHLDVSAITYVFCSDEYLRELNRKNLQHDYYTDILTFDYRENPNEAIESDIFISIERVMDNSKEFDTTFAAELKRVMAHGLLHLSGRDDKTDAQKSAMRLSENQLIAL